jgi:hypothetical protein
MPFILRFLPTPDKQFEALKNKAESAAKGRAAREKTKSSRDEGLFKQVVKTLRFLQENPKHPGLKSHEYDDLDHPFETKGKVWESYIQNKTPGAYRIFWCYGPGQGEITIIAITPHP